LGQDPLGEVETFLRLA